jgi:hypothetical protein
MTVCDMGKVDSQGCSEPLITDFHLLFMSVLTLLFFFLFEDKALSTPFYSNTEKNMTGRE